MVGEWQNMFQNVWNRVSTIRNQNINKPHQKLTQAILNEKIQQNPDQNKIHILQRTL